MSRLYWPALAPELLSKHPAAGDAGTPRCDDGDSGDGVVPVRLVRVSPVAEAWCRHVCDALRTVRG